MDPYYQDDTVTLYNGSLFDVLPQLGQFDACIADPPYGQTSLAWDRWPDGWLDLVAEHTRSLWCFGTLRMFLDRSSAFSKWRLSQDVVWEKARATTVTPDRFRRRHELVTHWYQGAWRDIRHELPLRSKDPTIHTGTTSGSSREFVAGSRVFGGYGARAKRWADDGMRYMTSIIPAAAIPPEMRRLKAINATQKPIELIEPLIEYGVPEGGIVLDPFAGSCSTGVAARNLGRRAVLIEAREEQCESAALRLSELALV